MSRLADISYMGNAEKLNTSTKGPRSIIAALGFIAFAGLVALGGFVLLITQIAAGDQQGLATKVVDSAYFAGGRVAIAYYPFSQDESGKCDANVVSVVRQRESVSTFKWDRVVVHGDILRCQPPQ